MCVCVRCMFSIFVYMYYMHACSALEEIHVVQDRKIDEATPIYIQYVYS